LLIWLNVGNKAEMQVFNFRAMLQYPTKFLYDGLDNSNKKIILTRLNMLKILLISFIKRKNLPSDKRQVLTSAFK